MAPRGHSPARVVGIGASAGGVGALVDVVSGLPAGLPHGDSSDGARLVLQAGGRVLVQDPAEAIVPSMPERTIALVDGAATVLSAREIGSALGDLPGAASPAPRAARTSERR